MTAPAAPAWSTDRWFNIAAPLTLDALRGRVVMLHAFQMLCPGCVSHGIPQAQRVARQFADAPVTVVGLHTVFEHHDVMGPEALEVPRRTPPAPLAPTRGRRERRSVTSAAARLMGYSQRWPLLRWLG